LVAAGFGSKQGAMRREALNKVFKILTLSSKKKKKLSTLGDLINLA